MHFVPRHVLRFRLLIVLSLLLCLPATAQRRRAVQHPGTLTPEAMIATAMKAADRVTLQHDPRLHWENAVYFDGLILLGEQLELRSPGSGKPLIERAATVLLGSSDAIDTVYWADGTAFGQAALDLYRVLPPSDPRRPALLALLAGPMRFAQHALREPPAVAAPAAPWWVAGGYGARFWQDDLYMAVPWLAMYGSHDEGLPGNELARNLAYEWVEAYVNEHRPLTDDVRERAVPSLPSRRGSLLWDESFGLFQHAPETIGTTDAVWARGNGWALIALARAAAELDAPYTGGRYDRVLTPEEIRVLLRRSAASLLERRMPDGGWASHLSTPRPCPVSETSGTALLTFFLARGVNEGWLDRDVYAPVVMQSLSVVLRRVDAEGSVRGLQPPDTGPGCGSIASTNGTINMNYGPGAILLAVSEALKFPAR